MARRPSLQELVPETRALRDDELKQLVEAAVRRAGAEQARNGKSIGAVLIVLFLLLFTVVAAAVVLGPLLEFVELHTGYWAVAPALALLGLAIWLYLRSLIVTDWQQIAAHSGALRFVGDRCVRCDYSLSGLAAEQSRPGVVRCPECGLVNPVIAPATDRSL